MYKTSTDVISLLQNCAPQAIQVNVDGVVGLTYISGADIVRGSFALDRFCFPEGTSFIGEAVAAEVSFTLSNRQGKFTGKNLKGARLSVSIGVRESVDLPFHLVPLGIFTVDEATRSGYDIHVSALDNLALMDRPYTPTVTFPATYAQIAQDACSQCGLILATVDFLNAGTYVSSLPSTEEVTCRGILRWIAAVSGGNVYADWIGCIRIAWLEETSIRLAPSNRYYSEISDDTVTVTGLRITATDGTTQMVGASGYVIGVEDNGLVQQVPFAPASAIASQVIGFTCRPFEAECRPMPYLWPMDVVTFVERDGTEHSLAVSAVTYIPNGRTHVRCEGPGTTVFDRLYPSTYDIMTATADLALAAADAITTEQEESNHA